MENTEEKFKNLQTGEIKLKRLSAISAIALGLGLQAFISPPSPIPFMQNSSVAYAVLGFGVIGMAISSTLIISALKERSALAKSEENA